MSKYNAAFVESARSLLPEDLYKKIKSKAVPLSGSMSRWQIDAPSVFEKVAVPIIASTDLASIASSDLKSLLTRMNSMYVKAFRKKENCDNYLKAARNVVSELEKRKLSFDKSRPLPKAVLFKEDTEVAKDGEGYFPRSVRNMTTVETVDQVSSMGRKFEQTPEESNYVSRSSNPYTTCSGCVFFLRDANSSIGSCMVVEGPIPWYGTSDHFIGALDEAGAIFHQMHEAVEDALMDSVFAAVGKAEESEKEPVVKMIRKLPNGKYQVLDRAGKKVLGTHDTRSSALRQLRAIESRSGLTDIDSRKRLDKAQPTASDVHVPGGKSRKDRDKELEEISKSIPVPIAKIDGEAQKVFGVVLEPDTVDTQGDTISAEEIEKAAEFFMRNSRVIGLSHTQVARDVELTDSYVTQGSTTLGKNPVKKGTWIIGVKINDPVLWRQIKGGEFTGFSVGGRGERVKLR